MKLDFDSELTWFLVRNLNWLAAQGLQNLDQSRPLKQAESSQSDLIL